MALFDAREHSYLPQFGTAVLGGIEKGQSIRKTGQEYRLGNEAQALGQQYLGATGDEKAVLGQRLAMNPKGGALLENIGKLEEMQTATQAMQKDFMARGAYDILNAPPQLQQSVRDKFLSEGLRLGYIPQEMQSEIGQPLDDEDMETLQQFVRSGREFSDLTKVPEPFTLSAGQTRYDAQGKPIASVAPRPDKESKPKPVPINFSKQFNDRLGMDIEDIDEIEKKDIELIRNATAAGMREGMDFEQAYNSAINSLGLQEESNWGGYDYKLAPQQEQAPKQASQPQQMPAEAMQRLEQIKKRRMELEAMRVGGGA